MPDWGTILRDLTKNAPEIARTIGQVGRELHDNMPDDVAERIRRLAAQRTTEGRARASIDVVRGVVAQLEGDPALEDRRRRWTEQSDRLESALNVLRGLKGPDRRAHARRIRERTDALVVEVLGELVPGNEVDDTGTS